MDNKQEIINNYCKFHIFLGLQFIRTSDHTTHLLPGKEGPQILSTLFYRERGKENFIRQNGDPRLILTSYCKNSSFPRREVK